uniref:Uncharacterized protein n=1 Tax=Cucumis melo TaxID=3656 RepID=A0A9I9EHV5_CUCME
MKRKNHNKRSTGFVEKWERDSMAPICETFTIDINVNLDRHSKKRNFSLSLSVVHKRRDRRCLGKKKEVVLKVEDLESGERIMGNIGDNGLGELDYGKVEGGGCWYD